MVFLRTHQPYSGTEVLMETKLERIAEISASSPRPEFTSLYHLINKEMLLQCHKESDGNKAVGVDEITKKEYERNLEQNIDDLVERLKRKSYKPQPSIRVYIPKRNSDFKAYCVAYMVSSRYGVDTRGFNFDRLPKEYAEMEPQDFKSELGSMRDVLGEVQSEMYKSMEKNKPARNKEQER